MESLIPEYSMQGHVRERSGSALPGIAPSNTYLCKDGAYVAIAGNSDGIFKRLMGAIRRHDLAEDPRLHSNEGRVAHADMLDAAILAWTGKHDLNAVLSILEEAEVPSGRIYSASDIMADEQYRARQMIEPFRLPDGQWMDLPGIVPKLSDTPGQTRWLGPSLGEHTQEVLASAGITPEQYRQLQDTGIV